MAPLPKRKHSNRRQGKRRASIALPKPTHFKELSDGVVQLSHRISADGTYKGVQIVKPKKTKKE